VSQQRVGGVGVARMQADAHGRVDLELETGDRERLTERCHESLGRSPRGGSSIPVQVRQDREELVAAVPREDVAAPECGLHSAGSSAQHLVTDGVPERVVDELEAVEVDVQQRHRRAVAPRTLERCRQQFLDLRAVR
jgi:hypothetical protein